MSRAQLSLIPMALSIGHGCGASDSGNRCKNPLELEMIDSGNGAIPREIRRLIFCNLLEFKFLFPASATASPMSLQVMGRLWCPRTIMPGWMDAQPHT
jgi:hypothetical protein